MTHLAVVKRLMESEVLSQTLTVIRGLYIKKEIGCNLSINSGIHANLLQVIFQY